MFQPSKLVVLEIAQELSYTLVNYHNYGRKTRYFYGHVQVRNL